MNALARWMVRKAGLRLLLALALLMAALIGLAGGLSAAGRELGAGLLFLTAFLGVLAGLALDRLRLNGQVAGLISSVLGFCWLALRLGRLSEPLTLLALRLNDLHQDLQRWYWEGAPPDLVPVWAAILEVSGQTATILERLLAWLRAALAGSPAFDPLASTIVWNLLAWLAAVWAAWWVFRRGQALTALFPAGLLLAGVLNYTRGNSFYLAPLLISTFLLMAVVSHDRRERNWESQGIDFSSDVRADLGLVAVPLALVLVAGASLAPSISIQKLVEFAQQLNPSSSQETGPFGRALGLEPGPDEEEYPIQLQSPGLPRIHLLGSGPELSQRLVMTIQTGDLQQNELDLDDPGPPRYYWRSLTYDRYTGRGWTTSPVEMASYPAGAIASAEESLPYLQIRQQVVGTQDLGGLVYTAGDLLAADQDFQVAWRKPPLVIEGGVLLEAGDIFGARVASNSYTAESRLTLAGQAELQAAGTNYPTWVSGHYLSLPDQLPERVLFLARDLTARAGTSYERALAIESYLRTFPYTLDLPAPPASRDIVDYFLFDLKQGYCDYYASAMVVLARAAGLPARLVMGYASGEYDTDGGMYLVTEAEAHSWPELYFPGIGWVEFEPTAGRPAFERPERVSEQQEGDRPTTALPAAPGERMVSLALLALGGMALAGLLVAGAWLFLEAWRLRRLPPAAAVAHIFLLLKREAARLAAPSQPGETPLEFSAAFAGRLVGLSPHPRADTIWSQAGEQASCLANLYTLASYSPHPPGGQERDQAIHTWLRLRWRLWQLRLARILFH